MKLFVFLCVVALAQCGPVAQDESILKLMVGNFVNCMNSDLSLCLKEHALRATERLRSVRQLKIIDGVTIINNVQREARNIDNLSTDPEIKKKQVTQRLWESTQDLIQNGELELSYAAGDDGESRGLGDVVEGRDKKKKEVKKKLKMLIPLAIIGKIKAIALTVLFLGVIAASLFKLAVLAKIAFIAKVIAIIKALIAKKHAAEEQGWVAHEEHGGGHGGWEGGWSRSRNEAAQNLAYSAYKN